ncbi:MAG: formylglycine-generating enzyme family protein [Fibrobacterota bacterium]
MIIRLIMWRYLILFSAVFFMSGCLVEEQCYSSEDCSGECIKGECVSGAGDVPETRDTIECPQGMVNIENRYCMDRYEASRSDADSVSYGLKDSIGLSRKNVLPWFSPSLTYEEASAACSQAGKRLCTDAEWEWACQNGSSDNVYPYGDVYEADICNGIDAFCPGEPYPHCFEDYRYQYVFKPVATGDFSECACREGVYDLSGNVWEWVTGTRGEENHLRGGAYNCGNSEELHKCSYKAGDWASAKGFRCCHDGLE